MKKRLLIGLAFGVALGVVYSGWALFVWSQTDGQALAQYGLDLAEAIGSYMGGGVVGGLGLGVLLPIRRYALGSVFLGFVVVSPISTLLVMASTPSDQWWNFSGIPLALIIAAVIGGLFGIMEWSQNREEWKSG